jgi:hypothetical protein
VSPKHPKNPLTPKAPLKAEPKHLITYDQALWRIHTTVGTHPSTWDELRAYGPISRFRWDPHPSLTQLHPEAAVSYTATKYVTAFAEVFQDDQAITLSASRALSGWYPNRPLTLLDLVNSDWALHHGASASLPQATKNICRNWSSSIRDQLGRGPDALLDGAVSPSQRLIPRSPKFLTSLEPCRCSSHGHFSCSSPPMADPLSITLPLAIPVRECLLAAVGSTSINPSICHSQLAVRRSGKRHGPSPPWLINPLFLRKDSEAAGCLAVLKDI